MEFQIFFSEDSHWGNMLNCYRSNSIHNDVPQVLVLSDDIAAAYGSTIIHYNHAPFLQYPSSLLTWQDIANPSYHSHHRRFEPGTTHGQARKLVAEALERLLSSESVLVAR